MFEDVSSTVHSDTLEKSVLDYWEQNKIFEQSLEHHKEDPLYTFYDGPPYATGKPHYGHVLQSAIKDTVLRYKTMQGYYIPRRVGWDCHGLPVEVLVEKQLGLKSKKDIEALGIEKFNQACREIVFQYIDEFTSTLKRIGRWSDYENAYATLNQEYMEAEWGVFKQLWDKELIYKAFKSTPYCVRCATPLSNHELTMSYKDKTDNTVYVKLRVKNGLSLLVWTTTPWTLPGNAAVAFNPEVEYVSVKLNDEEYILAKDRVAALFGEVAEITQKWTPPELEKLIYEPLYPLEKLEDAAILGEGKNAYRVIPGEFVTAQDGTGLVHIAPAFGEDDSALGKKFNIPVLRVVDTQGHFVKSAQPTPGKYIFGSLNIIIEDLKNRNLLFKEESYTHSYPFCWRCDTPLIYYALDTWFVKVSALKQRMLALNEDIHWTPEHVKHGRFGKGIESAPDWAISRNRFWSVPLPIWECGECQHRVCIGSVSDLKEQSGVTEIKDLHRPYVDDVKWKCEKCSGQMQRIPEVLDVWFDAGSMPYAAQQPGFPADFIIESIEQTRLWFYVLHVLATAVKDQAAYKNVIGSGLIFAEDGQKLSKKLKNYPEIEPTLEKYGADVLRFYLLTSSSLGEPYRFSEKDMRQVQRAAYMTLWNVYSFFVRYARVHEWEAARQSGEHLSNDALDKWILARLHKLEYDVVTAADEYQIDTAARAFTPFVDDLSNWYLRRSRTRFQKPASEQEKNEAFGTLYTVLTTVTKLLAPFMPFVTEDMYRNLTGEESVHLAVLPKKAELAEISGEQTAQLDAMQHVRDVVAQALALRAEAKIKVRQPLSSVTVTQGIHPELQELLKDEVNVKEVKTGKELKLDTVVTPELQAEGMAREIIRHGQVLRREAKYELDDRIKLFFKADDAEVKQAFETHEADILVALQVDEIVSSEDNLDQKETVKINGKPTLLGVGK